MPTIKIKSGFFGWKHDKGYKLVQAGDPPISVDAAVAQRLVEKLHIAEYVEVKEVPAGDELDTMNPQNLRALGKEHGLTFPFGATKSEMANAIRKAMNQADTENVDDKADDSAEEVVEGDADEAPTFDAAEAVQ